MLVREVKALAGEWVSENASQLPGFMGGFFRGYLTEAHDDTEFPISSDLDLTLVFEDALPENLLKEVHYDGVIIGGGFWPVTRLQPLERVLSDYRIGYSFRLPHVLPGASDKLCEMAAAVSRNFPKRHWVMKRTEDARANCLKYVNFVSEFDSEFDKVLVWLWAAGITTHIILAAALRNPTIRKRYLAAREVLSQYGHLDFYEFLLTLQGSHHFDSVTTQTHFHNAIEVFDVACEVCHKPFPYSSEIKMASRPKLINGTQELITKRFHRESVFWIVATYARCLRAFEHIGASSYLDRFRPGFEHILGDLGIKSLSDLGPRTEQVKASIPRAMAIAQLIMEAHPTIEDS